MTCIVALARRNKVYFGADSAVTDEETGEIYISRDPKIFRSGKWIIGMAGACAPFDVARFSFTAPDPTPRLGRLVRTEFVPELRKAMKAADLTMEDSWMLAGVQGHLFIIMPDYGVDEIQGHYAIGCGASPAIGALDAMRGSDLKPATMLRRALVTSERRNWSVRRPFRFLES
jgi:ATP-dependent protease HslVU (ClpYQ) peptidase subunit